MSAYKEDNKYQEYTDDMNNRKEGNTFIFQDDRYYIIQRFGDTFYCINLDYAKQEIIDEGDTLDIFQLDIDVIVEWKMSRYLEELEDEETNIGMDISRGNF